jgi:hypothetical protein
MRFLRVTGRYGVWCSVRVGHDVYDLCSVKVGEI